MFPHAKALAYGMQYPRRGPVFDVLVERVADALTQWRTSLARHDGEAVGVGPVVRQNHGDTGLQGRAAEGGSSEKIPPPKRRWWGLWRQGGSVKEAALSVEGGGC